MIYLGIALTMVGIKGIYDVVKERIEYPALNDTQLQIGYEKKDFIRYPVIVDMEKTPHILVCGLSGNGKSKMVEYAVKGKNVILINVFKKDLKAVKARRINGNEKILKYFNDTLQGLKWHDIPLYIVIDELLILCNDTKVSKAIMDVLAVGRHYNIYLIGICQIGTKESVKFKDLFNVRVCFRQVEESSYRTVLGYTPEDKDLQKRQFYYYSDNVGMGYTYDI